MWSDEQQDEEITGEWDYFKSELSESKRESVLQMWHLGMDGTALFFIYG